MVLHRPQLIHSYPRQINPNCQIINYYIFLFIYASSIPIYVQPNFLLIISLLSLLIPKSKLAGILVATMFISKSSNPSMIIPLASSISPSISSFDNNYFYRSLYEITSTTFSCPY